jgi:hypothetical protein
VDSTDDRASSVGERGSVSILMTAFMAVVAALVGVIAVGGAIGVAAARAQGAADVSSLAAASHARDLRALHGRGYSPEAEPCAIAREIAEAWTVAISSCVVAIDGTVEVTISTKVAGITVVRRSRAGTG